MKNKTIFILSFRLLTGHKPGKLLLIFLLTLFLGTSSGLTIVLLIPLLQLLTSGLDDSSNQIVRVLYDLAQQAGIELNLETILIVYILLLSFIAILNFWKSLLSANYRQTLIFNLRRRLYRKIIMAEWQFLNNKSKTNHLQILTREIPNLYTYLYFVLKLITGLIMALSYIFWAFMISSLFTSLILGVGLLLFVSMRKFLFKAFGLGNNYVESYSHLLKYIDDFWGTVKMAKVHGTEDFYYKKFDKASSSLLNIEYAMQKNNFQPQLIYRLMGIVVLAGFVYLGYNFELIPLTSFFILIILFARIYPQFTTINTDINMIVSNFASVKLVMKVDNEFAEPDMKQHHRLEPLPLQKQIKIKQLNFSYNGKELLFENFNTSLPAYNMIGIIGESGKGKTTLLDIIAGIQQPKSGDIIVDHLPLDDDSWLKWRNGIGYLPQDSFFIDGTIRENLIWDCRRDISDEEIRDVLKQVNALHLVNRQQNNLDEFIVNYPFHFSGGERQRLALARVLLRRPQILLLDEATSSLDLENEKQIMDLLVSLKHKITILLVTHKTTVKPWLDKVIKISS